MLKGLVIVGTRPEAIKMAPLVVEMQKRKNWEVVLVSSGQHSSMLDMALSNFNLTCDHTLVERNPKESIISFTADFSKNLDAYLEKYAFDYLFVHGDTATTFSAALVGFYRGVKVIHIEAGLRTFNLESPFPEEANRQLVSRITSHHFAPTRLAYNNLIQEGIGVDTISVVGNTVIDSLRLATGSYGNSKSVLEKLLTARDFESYKSREKRIILVTCHRRENIALIMNELGLALRRIITERIDIIVILPMHINPVVRRIIKRNLEGLVGVYLIEPLDYLPFIEIMRSSYLIVTDSGGIQEEAPFLKKPVLLVRDTTERPEALEAGTVKLTGLTKTSIYRAIWNLLEHKENYQEMINATNPYGDGFASNKILDILEKNASNFSS